MLWNSLPLVESLRDYFAIASVLGWPAGPVRCPPSAGFPSFLDGFGRSRRARHKELKRARQCKRVRPVAVGAQLSFQRFQNRLQGRGYVGTSQADGEISLQETNLVAAIVARTCRADCVERDLAQQTRESVGQLNFVSGPALAALEFGEDGGRQNIAPNDTKA